MSEKQSTNSNNESQLEHDNKGVVDPLTGARTTGHVWDDDLQEFTNPLPTWWLWGFYATFVFAIVYWIIYPSWPIGFLERGFSKGAQTISYKDDEGKEHTTHWNMRALLIHEQQNNPLELKRREIVKTIASMRYDDIAVDADKLQFVQSYGKHIFGDYCAACHQKGAQGIIGYYPNLIDDDWLWGIDNIETTIRNGRHGNMPAHKSILTSKEIDQAANFVLSLSGEPADKTKIAAGKAVFENKGCTGCHGSDAKGMKALGSANLTDKIWTVAPVSMTDNADAKLAFVKKVITNGIKREMPAWNSRLTDDEIKILVAFIKSMSANSSN